MIKERPAQMELSHPLLPHPGTADLSANERTKRKKQPMSNPQRHIEILRLLQLNSPMSVKQLADELEVSEMTIRRDLKLLSQENKIQMTHGLAFSKAPPDNSYDVIRQQGVHQAQKEAIGRYAASLIQPGDSIFIDCGSTAAAMPRYLPPHMNITVMCSSANTLVEILQKDVANLIFSGGYYHKSTQTFESPEALNLLGSIRASKAFVTAAGVNQEMGLTCTHQYEVRLKQLSMDHSLQTILLVDSSKFDRVSPVYFGGWEQIHTVITDEGIPDAWQQFLEERGIECIAVPVR